MPDTLFHTRAQLEARKKALNAELKEVNSEIASVSDMILESFAEEGVSSVKLDDGATVYQHQQLRATVKAADWEAEVAGEAAEFVNGAAMFRQRSQTLARSGVNTWPAWEVSIDEAPDFAGSLLNFTSCSSAASTSTPSPPGSANASRPVTTRCPAPSPTSSPSSTSHRARARGERIAMARDIGGIDVDMTDTEGQTAQAPSAFQPRPWSLSGFHNLEYRRMLTVHATGALAAYEAKIV